MKEIVRMVGQIKVEVTHSALGVCYIGHGGGERTYSIHKQGAGFIASFISGSGQHVTASGRSPLEALRRAESVQFTLAY